MAIWWCPVCGLQTLGQGEERSLFRCAECEQKFFIEPRETLAPPHEGLHTEDCNCILCTAIDKGVSP